MITHRCRVLLGALVVFAVLALGPSVAMAAPDPQIALGEDFSVLIKPDGSLFAWGINDYGQLGLGVHSNRTRAVRVGTDADWATIAAGDFHVLAIKTDGSLWAWGDNRDGRLGLGDLDERDEPTKVGTDTDWTAIAGGDHFSLALKADHTLWAWGRNDYGQLGLNDTTNRLVPTQVNSDTDWASISAGRYFAAAIKEDGTLWVWGRNDRSQLGLGNTVDHLAPVQLGLDTDWAVARCGDVDMRALKTDHTLWAWGYNNYGQLGLGDTVTRSTPQLVGTRTDWGLLTAGDDNSLATSLGGVLWAWGDNTYGQLGQGDRTHLSSPTQVPGAGVWTDIRSGDDHSGGLQPDGGLWMWGDNVFGQLGLGDLTDRLVPTLAFNVNDVTAPEILTVTSSSHPVDTSWYADNTPTFDWTVGPDESGVFGYGFLIDQSMYTIPNMVTTGTDTTWTAPAQADGSWYFHVRASDRAGNWGSMKRLRVKIDTTGPVTEADVAESPVWTKNNVTVHLTPVDAGVGTVTGTEYKVDSAGAWTSGTQVSVSTEGQHTVAYRSTDGLGNVEADKSSSVWIDKTAPVTTDNAPTGWSTSAVTVKLTPTDSLSGVPANGTEYRIGSGTWAPGTQVTVSSEGTSTIHYRSTDAAGNVESEKSCEVSIDKTAPLTTDDAPAGWSTAPVTVKFTANDDGGSGVDSTEYRVGSGSWTPGTQVTVSTEGTYTIYYRSTDAAGNVESEKSCELAIDMTAPVTTDDAPNGWSNEAITVAFDATDGGSGVAGTEYRIGSGSWTPGTEVTVSSEGTFTIHYRSIDTAGNVEAEKSFEISIDKTVPVTTDNAPAGWSTAPVTVEFTAGDAGGSGLRSTEYRVGSGSWTPGAEATVSTEGTHTLYYRSIDNAGNVEGEKSCQLAIDMTAPVTTDNAPAGWGNAPVTVTLTATDEGSTMTGGSAKTEYSLTGVAGTWVTGTSVNIPANLVTHVDDGAHIITYRSVDAAGNVGEAKTCTVRIDTRRPAPRAPKAASVRRGRYVTLAYWIGDVRPGCPTATVTIKIRTLSGKTMKQVVLRDSKVNTLLGYKFRCTLAKRTYKFYVYARDAAGNVQLKVASNKLVVK